MNPTDETIQKGITPLYVVLPFCTQFSCDVFLDVLKKVVARTKLGDNHIEGAFISGMEAKVLFIEPEDLSTDWTEKSSKSKQIRLSKLIGFWSVNNFPSLGKKVFGGRWQPFEERKIVIGDGALLPDIDDKELDSIIFQKFVIRVIQLNVNSSTFAKVKHFVAVPASVCKTNFVRISKKMKMFEIQDLHMENCWSALKSGKYFMNEGFGVSFLFHLNKVITVTLKYNSNSTATNRKWVSGNRTASK